MSKKITLAVAGLGSRGFDTYAKSLMEHFKDEAEIVAIADIVPAKVDNAKNFLGISDDMCFSSAEEMFSKPQLADAVLICTQDRQHVAQGMQALKQGYHILMEKPVSPELNDLGAILKAAEEAQKHVVVCHVLRYTVFFSKLKEIIQSGVIGDVVSIQAMENVCYFHQAHSFVRGNWNNSNTTSPMILQKSCHDMDILLWLAGKNAKTVSSFGDLHLFKESNAPKGSTEYCLGGCAVKETCPFDAEKIYITNEKTGVEHGDGWPVNTVVLNPTKEKVYEAIKSGPYGKCVYHCDNNVVDHQVVNIQLEDNATISFTMCAFTSKGHRYVKVMGTNGDIVADMDTNTIDICQFGKENEREIIDVNKLTDDLSGHAGGDNGLLREFISTITGEQKPGMALTSLDKSVESHFVALAAEKSRLNNGENIDIKAFAKG